MKKCPFCAEEIADEAIKCKHCGEMLNQINSEKVKKDKEDRMNRFITYILQKRSTYSLVSKDSSLGIAIINTPVRLQTTSLIWLLFCILPYFLIRMGDSKDTIKINIIFSDEGFPTKMTQTGKRQDVISTGPFMGTFLSNYKDAEYIEWTKGS